MHFISQTASGNQVFPTCLLAGLHDGHHQHCASYVTVIALPCQRAHRHVVFSFFLSISNLCRRHVRPIPLRRRLVELNLCRFRPVSAGKRAPLSSWILTFAPTVHKRWTHIGVSTTDVGTNAHAVLIFYFALEIAGSHVLLPVLVAIFAFSTRATRHPTLINLCLVWILSGVGSVRSSATSSGTDSALLICFSIIQRPL